MADTLPVEMLREMFDYDPATGVLTWKKRPRQHFASERVWLARNTKFAGKQAGTNCHGYIQLTFRVDGVERSYRAHRIIWAMTAGAWPKDKIDHRNGDPSDNRFANLREATDSENQHNRITKPTCGTVFLPKLRRFRAAIYLHGKVNLLGNFATREEAHLRYLAAKAELHPFQPIPREAF